MERSRAKVFYLRDEDDETIGFVCVYPVLACTIYAGIFFTLGEQIHAPINFIGSTLFAKHQSLGRSGKDRMYLRAHIL